MTGVLELLVDLSFVSIESASKDEFKKCKAGLWFAFCEKLMRVEGDRRQLSVVT